MKDKIIETLDIEIKNILLRIKLKSFLYDMDIPFINKSTLFTGIYVIEREYRNTINNFFNNQ